MSWQVLIALSVLLYSFSVLLQKVLLKDNKSDPVSFSIFFQIGVSVIIGALVLLVKGGITIPDMSQIWIYVLLMTILYGLANISIFKSLKLIDASQFGVIIQSRNLFAIIGTSLIFNEILTTKQWVGAILLIAGVIVVSLNKTKFRLDKGSILALVAGLLFGAANVNDRFLVSYFDPYSYVVIGFLFPAIFISALYPKKLAGIKVFLERKFLFKMVLLCLIFGLSATAFFAALSTTGNASQLFSINAFSVITVVIFSIIFLKERDFMPRKIAGAILSLIGLLLVV
jgi:drug/metabolite transporter (DMT)-like permease